MIKHIKIKERSYKITFKKSNRAKRIQLKVYKTGEIFLIVPYRSTYEQGNNFLMKSISWLEKKVDKLDFNTEKLRYFGEEIEIKYSSSNKASFFVPSFIDNKLSLPCGNNMHFKDCYNEWLFLKAKEYIPKKVNELAKLYGFTYNKISVKRLKSRWGSCSSKKNLSFNYKLLYFNTKIIEYVIVHELCHLSQMNHSKNFWKLVEQIIPDYKSYKNKLSFNNM